MDKNLNNFLTQELHIKGNAKVAVGYLFPVFLVEILLKQSLEDVT